MYARILKAWNCADMIDFDFRPNYCSFTPAKVTPSKNKIYSRTGPKPTEFQSINDENPGFSTSVLFSNIYSWCNIINWWTTVNMLAMRKCLNNTELILKDFSTFTRSSEQRINVSIKSAFIGQHTVMTSHYRNIKSY